jgi:hypothetical protein
MTRQTWEEERDARLLERILTTLEHNQRVLQEILARLPPPPQFKPSVGIVVVPTESAKPSKKQSK